jgi:hypothetical protein
MEIEASEGSDAGTAGGIRRGPGQIMSEPIPDPTGGRRWPAPANRAPRGSDTRARSQPPRARCREGGARLYRVFTRPGQRRRPKPMNDRACAEGRRGGEHYAFVAMTRRRREPFPQSSSTESAQPTAQFSEPWLLDTRIAAWKTPRPNRAARLVAAFLASSKSA